MSALFLTRLIFDLFAAGLLLFGLSYWWLGNTAHEIAGTAMFLLVIVHNVFNRRWYGGLSRIQREARGRINIVSTFVLMASMLVLLITSVLISHTLSDYMSAYGGFTARQIHTVVAYWLLVIVAVHLGLRWPLIMGAARSLLSITKTSAIRLVVLRVIAIAIAIHGVWSSFQLGIGSKLAMSMTLDWWNFEESIAAFFIHCIAVAGLYIVVTYYGLRLIGRKSAA